MVQTILSQTFTSKKKPCKLIPVTLPAYTTYEKGTVCSEMSAHKILMLGNHPKKEYNIHNKA
jgi:hypothetical protein